MVEIKKIEAGMVLEENQPIIRYMMNNTELALIHFLEESEKLGQIVLPEPLDRLVEQIETDDKSSRCFWSPSEGYIAQKIQI